MTELNERPAVELYRDTGPTTRTILAYIDDAGAFVLAAQDIGETPREIWGDDDYEFWVTVQPDDKAALANALAQDLFADPDSDAAHAFFNAKNIPGDERTTDRALLALTEKKYANVFSAVDDFREFAGSNGIPHKFESWV